MRGFIYLDVVEGGRRVKMSERKKKGERVEKKEMLAEPQKLLRQHVKNVQFFNS